jgi:Ser/Thr protein kinase RdoA (MazF antagonist)
MDADHRLAELASLLKPGTVAPRVESFPDTPTGWASAYGLEWAGEDRCVIRLLHHAAGSLESAEAELAAASLMGDCAIGPAIRHRDARAGVLVMDWIDGAPARPARDWQAASVACLLARLHAVPWTGQPDLHETKWADATRTVCGQVESIPRLDLFAEVLGAFRCLRQELNSLKIQKVLCHNDLNPGNMLFDSSRAWLVDFDHVGRSDPLFDVATAIEALDLNDQLVNLFMREYLGRTAARQEVARLELLRCLVLLRYGLTTLALVPESCYQRLAMWGTADTGRPFVFDRSAGEEFGWSVFRLSLGFATTGLARLRTERVRRAASVLRMGGILTDLLGGHGDHAYGDAAEG